MFRKINARIQVELIVPENWWKMTKEKKEEYLKKWRENNCIVNILELVIY